MKKDIQEIFDELESLMIKRSESKLQAQIERIMRRHEFYEKGNIDAIIEKSSEEIADMIEHMINQLK